MKKKLALTIGSMAAAGILGFAIFNSGPSVAEATMSMDEIKTMVTEQYPGEITEIERETEFNRAIYEVEISNDEKEYDIKLDGNTGEILDIKEKPVKKSAKAEQKDKIKEETSTVNDIKITEKGNKKPSNKQDEKSNEVRKTVISVEEAKEIALNEFPGKIDDIELDEEDGRLIYEIEIERGDKEAEIEIDAYTGEIIVMEIDED